MKQRLLLLAFAACAMCCGNAAAHALPERMVPAAGSILNQAPARVTIYFDASLEPVFSTLLVKDAHGVTVGQGAIEAGNPKALNCRVPALAKGAYRVYWDVVSRDGHRANGDYTFTIK